MPTKLIRDRACQIACLLKIAKGPMSRSELRAMLVLGENVPELRLLVGRGPGKPQQQDSLAAQGLVGVTTEGAEIVFHISDEGRSLAKGIEKYLRLP